MYRLPLLFFFSFFALTIDAQDFENVVVLDQWSNDSLPTINNGIRYNECWGFVRNGEEYGVMGSTMGTHIFRLTDDDQLEEVAYVPGAFQGGVVHRDFHDYGDYLYAVCDQGSSTLQVIDISELPDTVTVVYDSNEFITTAHNVFVDTSSAKLYAAGTSVPMLVLSVENPSQPEFLYPFFQVNYVHDLFVRSDTAYLNCADQGLQVVDFSGEVPQSLGSLTVYPEQGYNHSGWLSEDGDLYILADENDGLRMKACDVSDLGDIEVLSLFGSEVSANSVPHNLQIINDTVYVAHYNDGLQVFDLTDPGNPERIAFYDTFTGDESYSFNGGWGVFAYLPSKRILMSDRTSGLYLFRFDFTTGVGETAAKKAPEVFPNPTSGPLSVRYTAGGIDQITVYDFSGKTVLQRAANGIEQGVELDLSGLPKGMYVVELTGSGEAMRTNVIRF